MNTEEELYNNFAGLIYAIVMADNIYDAEEKRLLERFSSGHPLSKFLEPYFSTSDFKEVSIIGSYKKIVRLADDVSIKNDDITYMIGILEALSKVSKEPKGETLIETVVEQLKNKFLG